MSNQGISIGCLVAAEAIVLPRRGPGTDGFIVALLVHDDDVEDVVLAGGWDRSRGKTWYKSLHCTLSYVDDAADYAKAVDVVADVAKEFPPIELVTTRPGFFLPDDKPAFSFAGPSQKLVHYVGVNGPGLEALSAAIREGLRESGISCDTRFPVFTPHVTVEVFDTGIDDPESKIRDTIARAAVAVPCRFRTSLAVLHNDLRTDVPWSTESDSPVWMDSLLSALNELTEGEEKAGNSALAQHMTRAVFLSLRKRGENEKDAAKGAFAITAANLRQNGFLGSGNRGPKLTGKGGKRSRQHASEPEHKSKSAEYLAIKKIAMAKDPKPPKVPRTSTRKKSASK